MNEQKHASEGAYRFAFHILVWELHKILAQKVDEKPQIEVYRAIHAALASSFGELS